MNIKKATFWISIALVTITHLNCNPIQEKSDRIEKIKSYCLDFNWGEGGPNAFAEPGLWADADPNEHVKWYRELGVNTIQTFIVSCNGFAWYKNGVVPPQPGLKHDFLPELVELGHKEGMKVMGYLCIGSNTRWGMENPEYSYGYPSDRHIPFTDRYKSYLDSIIRDAIERTDIDGFMIDWFYQPNRSSHDENWLDSEKELYAELMGRPFPGEDVLTEDEYNKYSRMAIEDCWNTIYKVAKETKPDVIIWLTAFDITHPHYVNSKMFQEVDWLMNEEGDIKKIDSIKNMVGDHTQLITCLANWNKKDAKEVVADAAKADIGLYGFTKPDPNSLKPNMDHYFASPIDSFHGDDKIIATFARVFNEKPLDFIKK
jgi:uncharacterized lipoprotein YddW (UPF0748 family)